MDAKALPATVFIVDGEQGLLRRIETALRRKGYAVMTAASGANSVQWLTQNEADLLRLLEHAGNHTHWAVLLREVTGRKLAERRQELLHEMALVLAGADSLAEAAPKILQAVCRAFDWCFGELWTADSASGVLRHVCTSPLELASECWVKLTSAATFAKGVGVPGRVWASRQPAYVADLARESNCLRAKLALKDGVRSAFAFPILLRGAVLAVMVFYWRDSRAMEKDGVAFFTMLGSHLGQFIERRRAEKALRRSEANLASAQKLAHVGSYEINVDGTAPNHWSVELFRILGLDPAGAVLAPEEYIRRVVHPADQARVRAAFARSMGEGARFDLEYRVVQPDGTLRHVHSIAEPVLGPDRRTTRLVGALHDVTERKRLEKAVSEISEREQRRIGEDLHDSLGQELTAIELMCQSLRDDLASVRPDLARQASQMGRFLRQAIRQTRSLAHGLSAHKVQIDGLPRALADLAQTISSLGHLKCHLQCPSALALEETEVAGHLYRIAQEAVNNAVRHSRANELTIRLSRRKGVLRLQVIDNGRGLRGLRKAAGIGMQVMRHRADMIGAELEVNSEPGKGLTVSCTVRRRP